jgi:hypothetical protein
VRSHTTFVLAALAAIGIVASGCSRAQAFETFMLEEHDHLIAESPGCYTDCRVTGSRRTCTVRDFNCQVVCKTLPECRLDGRSSIKACAVIKTGP